MGALDPGMWGEPRYQAPTDVGAALQGAELTFDIGCMGFDFCQKGVWLEK